MFEKVARRGQDFINDFSTNISNLVQVLISAIKHKVDNVI